MNKLNSIPTRLTPEHLDEIRATVNGQVMFDGLGLRKCTRKSKPDDLWAFSPFHDERTASFHMSPRGLWYDFSISEGGGPIELVQRLEGLNCYEAGRFILDQGWAHVSEPATKPVGQRQTRTRANVERATANQTDTLLNDTIRQDLLKMCEYHPLLAERGISEKTCDLLGIGYLPQGRSPLKGRLVFQVADARQTRKSEGERERVILSHMGRALDDETEPKYLFYQGFHKSAELYGQELIWLHEEAVDQISDTKMIILTEGPFDVAKAVEAGLRNVVGSFGAALSDQQAEALKAMADAHGVAKVRIIFDRDEAGRKGADKAAAKLRQVGLQTEIFDWDAPIGHTSTGDVYIPQAIADLADLSAEQLAWLRQRRIL